MKLTGTYARVQLGLYVVAQVRWFEWKDPNWMRCRRIKFCYWRIVECQESSCDDPLVSLIVAHVLLLYWSICCTRKIQVLENQFFLSQKNRSAFNLFQPYLLSVVFYCRWFCNSIHTHGCPTTYTDLSSYIIPFNSMATRLFFLMFLITIGKWHPLQLYSLRIQLWVERVFNKMIL